MNAYPSASSPVIRELEQYREHIERCVKCGTCSPCCPSYQVERNESFSARGRMALVKAVLEGRLAVSQEFRNRLDTCVGCLACEAACPGGVPVTRIIQAAREEAREELGSGILATIVSEMVQHQALFHVSMVMAPLVLHLPKAARRRDTRRRRQATRIQQAAQRGRVAFFAGCGVNHFQPDLKRAVNAVLAAYGYEAFEPPGLSCCGRPLLSLGEGQKARALAEQNSAALAGLDAVAVVTACASCGLIFKKDYPGLLQQGADAPCVLDIHEFLADKEPLRPFPGALAGTVTVHEGCHLNRGQGLSKAFRNLLRLLPGITLVEMRNADACCGFGGVMRIAHRKHSDAIADRKVTDILATGAATVVTGCPGCRMQLAGSLARNGADIEVVHSLELVERILGPDRP